MQDLINIIKKIELIILDVDGVLTDGLLFYGKDGEHLKVFNVKDGQGIKLAQNYGIKFAIVSGRESEIVKNRFSELGIKHIIQHCKEKGKAIREITTDLNISLENTVFIGDDILDVPALEIVGLPVCPSDAHHTAKSKAKIITEACGGKGCVREIIDLVLKEKGMINL